MTRPDARPSTRPASPPIPPIPRMPAPGREWRLLRDGDSGACERWLRRELPSVLALCRPLLNDEQAVRAIAREQCGRVLARIDQFDSAEAMARELRRSTLRVSLQRSRRAGAPVSLDDLLPCYDEAGRRAPGPGLRVAAGPASGRPVAANADADIRHSIDRLPDSCRAAVLLCDCLGLSRTEAAGAIDLSTAALRRALHLGRQALAAVLLLPFAEF